MAKDPFRRRLPIYFSEINSQVPTLDELNSYLETPINKKII